MKEIYNELFSHRYNNKPNDYHKFIPEWAEKIEGKILDAGCGRGHASRMLMEAGREVFAIEWSDACCKLFLKDIKHECSDIISYCQKEVRYGGVVCMGVLEHIPYEDIDCCIEGLSNVSDSALYAIANHSDIQNNTELHIIREGAEWWTDRLKYYYTNCELISRNRNRLFIFECNDAIIHKKSTPP